MIKHLVTLGGVNKVYLYAKEHVFENLGENTPNVYESYVLGFDGKKVFHVCPCCMSNKDRETIQAQVDFHLSGNHTGFRLHRGGIGDAPVVWPYNYYKYGEGLRPDTFVFVEVIREEVEEEFCKELLKQKKG